MFLRSLTVAVVSRRTNVSGADGQSLTIKPHLFIECLKPVAMLDPSHPIAKLLKRDRRFKLEAYLFVFEALTYAQNVLGLGSESAGEDEPEASEPVPKKPAKKSRKGENAAEGEGSPERHLTGQQLCEAIRLYALEQYGFMAKTVLNSWGVHSTGDFGEIVFNLIAIEQMRKTKEDRREDFDDVYDFETGLKRDYKIVQPE
jgi:uncharacterized repeat protein (TIGR04138 family)